MPFERPLTIKEAVNSIHTKKYLLPAIQREFVWSTDQIERLFDSLLRDYPIGSFLFWRVERQNTREFQFYEFIRDYHERDSRHNPKADVSGEEDLTVVLDGQQRLTSLYLGLRGRYAEKLKWKRRRNDQAFPRKSLFLNLLYSSGDSDVRYKFEFLTDSDAKKRDDSNFWFRVGEILDLDEPHDVNDYLLRNDLMNEKDLGRIANRTLFKLHDIVHKQPAIHYFLEESKELDKVLNIFIRVNSGGTQLSYSDLLLSIATAQWQSRDAREEIIGLVDEINEIGDGFSFDKDFVLKTCIVLTDFSDIKFKVDNFNAANMHKIEDAWDGIADAIRQAVALVTTFGYSRETLTSNYAVIPIAYYLYKRGMPKGFTDASEFAADRKNIQRWLALTIVKTVFRAQPDGALRPLRSVLAENGSQGFPLQDIVARFKGSPRSLTFDDDEIENLFNYSYGQKYTFALLSLIYPTLDYRNKFHVDHIHPRAAFTRAKLKKAGISEGALEYYTDNFNRLANLQLLEGPFNQEKAASPYEQWLVEQYGNAEERKDVMRKNYIPDVPLGLDNFEEFIQERQSLMMDELKHVLGTSLLDTE